MGELVEALISTDKFSLIASILFLKTSCANPSSPSVNTQVLLTCICVSIIELLGRVYLNIRMGDPFLDSLGPYDWIFIDVRRNSI